MALSTVEHDPRHAVREQVKNESEPWFRRRRARTRRAEDAQAQPSPVPQPEAPTRLLPPVEHAAQQAVKAAGQPPLHRDEHTVPDKVAINMIRVCSQALAEGWSSTRLHRELGMHNEELEKRWHRERDGGRKIEARRAATVEDAATLADVFEAAVFVSDKTGTPVDLDPEKLGADLAARIANAHRPDQPTMTFPRITEDTPDPREAAAAPVEVTVVPVASTPVHIGETAPVPAPPAAGLPPLPKRPVTSFEAHMGADGTPAHGRRAEASDVAMGDWLLHEGRWRLVLDSQFAQGGDGEQLAIRMAGGAIDTPHMSAPVHVLSSAAAKELLDAGAAK